MNTDITVAGLVVQAERALIVRERAGGRVVVNLPGGHIEANETAEQALSREMLEETGHHFIPQYVLGCYLWQDCQIQKRYLRIVFAGNIDSAQPPVRVSDANIVSSGWEPIAAVLANPGEHRYPIVQQSLQDYQQGRRMTQGPLDGRLPLAQQLQAVVNQAQHV